MNFNQMTLRGKLTVVNPQLGTRQFPACRRACGRHADAGNIDAASASVMQ